MTTSKKMRGDPDNHRVRTLDCGSQEEIGRLLVEVLRDEGDGHDPVYADGAFYEYRETTGLWTVVEEQELHRIVGSYDGTLFDTGGKTPRRLQVSDNFARGAIRRAAVRVASPDFFATAPPVLAYADRVVRISDAGDIEQLDHSPDHRARVGYPFAYDPEAKCERFEQMMREHFEGDKDAAEKIACEQEFFGGCLFGLATTYQKCLVLPCDGGGGRSTLLEIIENAFPAGSVSHIDARDLRNAERRTRLVGKLANLNDEVPPDAFLESEDFKRVVTGNVVTAEGKYRASFEFRPKAGHVFPVQMGAAAELSAAFFRRPIVIRYNRNFEGDSKRNLKLADEIIATELPGVVRWHVEGAARLRRQGGYTVPASHHRELQQWRMDVDTVMGFVAATMVRAKSDEPRNGTFGSDLYPLYVGWCGDNGHRKPVASNRFGERLKKIGVKWKHTEKGTSYAILTRERAEKREADLAAHEKREPRTIAGYFDKPPVALVQPDRLTDRLTGHLSGEKDSNSETYKQPDRLTGDRRNSLYRKASSTESPGEGLSAVRIAPSPAKPLADSPDRRSVRSVSRPRAAR